MNFPPKRNGWYAMAKAKELTSNRPLRRFLFDTPIALFGSPTNPKAVIDLCPHRGAPLSEGKVVGELIQCPYHGWSFDGQGTLEKIPCLAGDTPDAKLESFETCVHLGLIFVRLGDAPSKPYLNPAFDKIKFWRPTPGGAATDLAESAENFLDPTHTLYVHTNLFRSEGKGKPTQVVVTADEHSAEANYIEEHSSTGLVGKLMREKKRSSSVGRFVRPNVAEVEFHGTGGANFIMTGFLTPGREGEVHGYGVVGLPGPWLWALLKYLLLWPWMKLIHNQDKVVLRATQTNRTQHPDFRKTIGPLDIMRPQIDALLEGKSPPAAHKPLKRTLIL